MSEEKYTQASILLRVLTQKHPQSSKYWLNWSTCLKALKYTIAPKKNPAYCSIMASKNIDLQHSFAQSLAEMGKLKSYKNTALLET